MDIIELCAVSIFNIGKYRHANMTYFLWECGLGVKDVESGAINLKLVLLNYYIPKWRIVIPRNYIDTNGNILLLFQEEKRLDTEDTANSSSARSDRWVDFPFLIHVVVKCRCLGVEEILFMSEIFIFFMVKDVFGRFILSVSLQVHSVSVFCYCQLPNTCTRYFVAFLALNKFLCCCHQMALIFLI